MIRKYKHLKEKEFDRIKLFLTAGAKMRQVARILDRSIATVIKVNASKDWKNYEAINEILAQKRKVKLGQKRKVKLGQGSRDVSFPASPTTAIFINRVNKEYVEAEVAKIRQALQNLVALIK